MNSCSVNGLSKRFWAAEFQHPPRRNLECRADEATECGVMVVDGKMFASYPIQKVSKQWKLLCLKSCDRKNPTKEAMEQELGQKIWIRIKDNEEAKKSAITDVCSIVVLKLLLRRNLSNTGRYRKLLFVTAFSMPLAMINAYRRSSEHLS